MPFRRDLIVLVFLLLPLSQGRAQEGKPQSPDAGLGLKLKLQQTLLPASGPRSDEELPVFVEADRLEGGVDRYIQADGNVVLRRRGEAVFADQLRYSLENGDLTATGHARFTRRGDEVSGDAANYNLETGEGVMESTTYRFRQFHGRGQAERLFIRDRDRYRAVRATYTYCDLGDDDWYLKVQRLDIDRLRDIGTARNGTLYFKDVPIMYTPYLNFPLSGRRKSGLLAPTFGSTESSGFEVTVPFYWNIRPDMDYTIAPRIMAKRGVMFDNEFRYLRPSYGGNIEFDYLPQDRLQRDSRYGLVLQHGQSFGHGFSGYLNIQRVSDDAFFTDLSDKIAATSTRVLPSEAQLRYEGGWWSAFARSQRFQVLQDPLAPIVPPYARTPQVTLLASRQNLLGFDAGFNGEVVNFDHPALLNSIRQSYYPSVSYPYRTPFFFVTPKLGFSYTHYLYPSETQREDQTLALPIFSVDAGTSFERNMKFLGRERVQTLEPRVYYLYVPFKDQSDLPLFDTGLKDFNFTSLFSENKFSGSDRVNDANQITIAAITRLLDPATGAEQVRAALGQRYYFRRQQVDLRSNPPSPLELDNPTQVAFESSTESRSDILAALSGQLTRNWSVDTGVQYGVSSALQRFNVALRNQPEPGKVMNLAYRYTRDFIEQVDFSMQWPIARRWVGLGRVNWSLQDNSLIEALAGLEYNASCWAARLVIHRFKTSTQQETNSIFFQLELTGFSRLGTSALDLLRQGIGGYTRPSLRPLAPAEEYYPGSER